MLFLRYAMVSERKNKNEKSQSRCTADHCIPGIANQFNELNMRTLPGKTQKVGRGLNDMSMLIRNMQLHLKI